VAVFLLRASPVRVRLTRKLAEALNGLDLRPFTIGEVIDLTEPLAQMLIAERWAEEAVAFACPSTADDRASLAKKARGSRQPARSRSAGPPASAGRRRRTRT
jgi:hypothetical protein